MRAESSRRSTCSSSRKTAGPLLGGVATNALKDAKAIVQASVHDRNSALRGILQSSIQPDIFCLVCHVASVMLPQFENRNKWLDVNELSRVSFSRQTSTQVESLRANDKAHCRSSMIIRERDSIHL